MRYRWTLDQRIAKRAQSIFRMKREQDRSFGLALGLDEKQWRRQGFQAKLLFRKSQYRLIERIGLSKYADKIEVSSQFALKSGGTSVDQILFRRSLIMNLIVSCYRNACVIGSKDPFHQIVQHARDQTKQKGKIDIKKKDADVEDVVLYELTYSNSFDLAQSICSIASYNRRNPTVIEVFYGPFLDRLKSIMKIQTWFRYIIWRKQQNPLFKRRKNGKLHEKSCNF